MVCSDPWLRLAFYYSVRVLRCSPLPDAPRCSLMAVHASGRSKHSASPWRPEMDAYVLLRHVRDKISLPKVAQQWPFPPPAKKSRAVQLRWHNVLKGLDGIDELSLLMCGRCEEQEMSETQLNSTEVSLQPWVEDALVNLHARKKVPMNSNFTPWTIVTYRSRRTASCCTRTRTARRSLTFA